MSVAAPSAGVLLLVSDPERAEKDLPRILPGRRLRALRREDLKGANAMSFVRRLRSLGLDELVMLSDDLDSHENLWRLQALGALPLAPRRYLLDASGRRIPLSAALFVARDLPALALGLAAGALALFQTARRIRRLLRAPRHAPRPANGRRVAYLRSDLWAGIPAGGSVGHVAGTASGFHQAGADLFFISSSPPALIDPSRHPVHLVPRHRRYNIGRELPRFAHGLRFTRRAAAILAREPADLLYHRFDPGTCAGVDLSRTLDRPLVLEYNGSEIWVADHWDQPFRRRDLFLGLEEANLRHADLIVVVSEVLREELLARGVPGERILALPNGVDPGRYHPGLDGAAGRRRLGFEGRTVVGFIGTFGVWHGAPVLARAAALVLRERPGSRFLFVGDGPERSRTETMLREAGLGNRVEFTGLVPQDEGPAHLAAMDILAAPHVPNPDGSRFFGSPTKLFEYMAMGKAIVASRLEQIGDVLEHERTGILVPPADETALARAIVRLIDAPDLRERLGGAARRRALERHTWAANVRAIVERLETMGLLRWS
jgi:glycosyltransferase involved in cell wall biosynthesis